MNKNYKIKFLTLIDIFDKKGIIRDYDFDFSSQKLLDTYLKFRAHCSNIEEIINVIKESKYENFTL